MSVAAIDPGQKGAYAVLKDGDYIVVQLYSGGDVDDPTPAVEDLLAMGVTRVLIESVSGQLKTALQSGIRWGRLKQCLLDNGIGVAEVAPATWKGKLKIKGSRTDSEAVRKARSVKLCKDLFPSISLRRTDKCYTDSVDFAEALLILEYGRRTGIL